LKVAVLSGKGGTGKTLVSVNLAVVSENSTYIDCDVEEPNGHIFFRPVINEEYDVKVKIPVCNDSKCLGCRDCVEFCNFNALAYVNRKLMIFDEICHSCGGCMLVCKYDAIYEKDKTIGVIKSGMSLGTKVISGIMNTGEESGTPIINELIKRGNVSGRLFIDCPPGTSCSVIESIRDADICVIVTEPTVLGLHDFKMILELVNKLDKPYGIVLNKCTDGYNPSKQFCLDENLSILAEIQYDNDIAKLNSDGEILVRRDTRFRELFAGLLADIEQEVPK
jgi:MinD superfamily P-loop ATPase